MVLKNGFKSILWIEGSGGLEVPYLGYVEVCLRIPEVKAFDQDVLLLIVPNSTHTQYTPITLGTLQIDMAIKLATEEELRNLNKQWQRSLVATKLTMKEAQVLDIEEAQIVAQLDSDVKLVRDTTLGPFETIEMKGTLRKTPSHYKRMNVVVNDLGEKRSCKDIAVVHQLQILKPGSDRIPMVLWNLSGKTLEIEERNECGPCRSQSGSSSLWWPSRKGRCMWRGHRRHHQRVSQKIHPKRRIKECQRF